MTNIIVLYRYLQDYIEYFETICSVSIIRLKDNIYIIYEFARLCL